MRHKTASGHHKVEDLYEMLHGDSHQSQNRKRSSQGRAIMLEDFAALLPSQNRKRSSQGRE